MTDYRFYPLGSSEHAVEGEHHLLADDVAALTMAQKLCDRHGIEIWQGQRRVARVMKGDWLLPIPELVSL